MAAGDSGKVEGAVLGAAPSTPHPLALRIGESMARNVFEKRGNHTEAHLREDELAVICAAAAESAIVYLEARVNGRS